MGGCVREEQVFRVFQEKIKSSTESIEEVLKTGSVSFLLHTLLNCQKIELNDKFFYDTIIDRIDEKMADIT